MASLLTHLGGQRPVRLIGAITLRTAIGLILLVLLMVLAEAWAPWLVDPVLIRLGL